MRRTKADLRAVRELCGYSRLDMSAIFDVRSDTIKRWERGGDIEPPCFVYDWAESELEAHFRRVETVVGLVLERDEEIGGAPRSVDMTYFRSQTEYDRRHDDGGSFSVANATTCAVAQRLMALGYEVTFSYIPESTYERAMADVRRGE